MAVVGTRVPPDLGQKVYEHCRGLGKTPSQWVRELMERELAGKTPSPALGDAVQDVAGLVSHNSKLVAALLTISLGIFRTVIQMETLNHLESAKQLEKLHQQLAERLGEDLPAQGPITLEMGLKISDLASEIERIRGRKPL